MTKIKSDSIDLVLTDPPYALTTKVSDGNQGHTDWDRHRNWRSQWEGWDMSFTMKTLNKIVRAFYEKLRNGGTLILFCDLWKIETIKKMLERNNFKQIRMIEWVKSNPQP